MPLSISNLQKIAKVDLRRVRRSVTRLLRMVEFPKAEISLLLVDDAQIQVFNRTYLQRDRPTNVISFAMADGEFGRINPETLGDIIISVETAQRDAAAGQIEWMDEVEFLIVHGLLHLLGYNHETGDQAEAERMVARERELFFHLRHYDLD